MRVNPFLFAATILSIAAAPTALQAQTSFIGTRGGVGGSTLDWNTLYGASGSSVSSTPVATGISGLTLSTSSTGTVQRIDQGGGWSGGFLNGEALLWNQDNGILSLLFNTNVFAVGANIQGDFYGAFTGYINAYDASNVLLGSYSLGGTSDASASGNQPFLGISSVGGFRKVTFYITNSLNGQDFAINQLAVNGVVGDVVPEPATMSLLATGLVGLAGMSRRRKRA